MRKIKVSVAAMMLGVGALLMTSCIGSFSLSGKILKWNKKASNNKFLNEIVFFGLAYIVPVYGISLFVDAVLFNTLEFWSGKNPIAGVDKVVNGEKGQYHVKSTESGYSVELIGANQVANFVFNPETKTWTLEDNGQSINLVQFVDENSATVFFGNESMTINAANSAGLYAAR